MPRLGQFDLLNSSVASDHAAYHDQGYYSNQWRQCQNKDDTYILDIDIEIVNDSGDQNQFLEPAGVVMSQSHDQVNAAAQHNELN